MRTSSEDLQKVTAQLETALEEVKIEEGVGLRDHPLTRAAADLATTSLIGRIVLAGRTSSGNTWVQFNADGGSGYASTWPEWAFDLAKDALLYGKKVWVISDGSPFGSNLSQVLLYAP